MPKRRKHQIVTSQYFTWLVGPRQHGGVFYADGRSNNIDLGRHSLGTKDDREALVALRDLDLKMAVTHGQADASVLNQRLQDMLALDEGVKLYMAHVKRPRVMRGAAPKTVTRYKTVFDKFTAYASSQSISYWQQVTRRVLEGYGSWLVEKEYAYASEYLELTTVKQAINWLISEKYLSEGCRFKLPLVPLQGTTTYCWRDTEVTAMIERCASKDELKWLGQVLVGLVYTGMRIDELAQLHWPAVDFDSNMLRVIDNTRTSIKRHNRVEVSTKTHSSRSLPIHGELRRVLENMERQSDGRVFHGPTGKVLRPDHVRNVLIRDVLKPLALQFPGEPGHPSFSDGRLHSCRHYFCSKCAREGVPEQTVMLWLGHRDSDMVRHYYHLHDDDAQRQMSKLKSLGGSGAA